MKRNLAPLLGVAFVAALVATGFFYGLLIPRLRGGGESVDTGRVVVASKDLARGGRLSADHLHLAPVAQGKIPEGAVRTIEEAVGLTLLSDVSQRQVLTTAMLTRPGQPGGPSRVIPPGMRAVSIHPRDSMGVVAMLQAGSRVDVQLLSPVPGGGLRLMRALENIEVLHSGASDGSRAVSPVVTLLVSPRDADRLSLADASLNLRLVLRNPEDVKTDGPVAITSANLYEAPATPRP